MVKGLRSQGLQGMEEDKAGARNPKEWWEGTIRKGQSSRQGPDQGVPGSVS